MLMALAVVMLQMPGKSYGQDLESPLTVTIDVAPNVLNIQSEGTVVTVHTDLPYAAVDTTTVTLNGIEIDWWKADNRGYFVAKFEMSAVKDLVDFDELEVPSEIELTLYCELDDQAHTPYSGSQIITVIDIEPVGTGKK